MHRRDLRTADTLGTVYFAIGFAVIWGVGVVLAFPLEALGEFLPNAFVPTIDELWEAGDWRVFVPHFLYVMYGVLMMASGSMLRQRAEDERIRSSLVIREREVRDHRADTAGRQGIEIAVQVDVGEG